MPSDPMKPWGPENPHPLSTRKTELIWEGKYDEYGNRRPVRLPSFPLVLQKIETIDAPRDTAKAQGTLFEEETEHRDDFRNRLIWGDNKLALAALLPEFRGKVDLIYIDPPFDVGSDFTMDLMLGEGDSRIAKEQSVLEAVAYRDTWGKGADSYVQMLYERLSMLSELLSSSGSIYVHCDSRVSGQVRQLLDELLGTGNFGNAVAWKRSLPHGNTYNRYGQIVDTVFYYRKSSQFAWNPQYSAYNEESLNKTFRYVEAETGRKYQTVSCLNPNPDRPNLRYEWNGHTRTWKHTRDRMQQMHNNGLLVYSDSGLARYKMYLDEAKGVPVQDLWDDIALLMGGSREAVDFPTQKPEALLDRILRASSHEGDLVLDCFCGSGTTPAVAEKLGRRWIAVDLGRYAVHTTRKRLIGVQRELYAKGEPYRSFDVYNLGRYERQWWQVERLKGADEQHRATVLKFFRAAPVDNAPSPLLHGTKGGAYVHVDSIDSIMTAEELREVALAASAVGARQIVCLAWEFEMDLRKKAAGMEAELGLEIRLKYIPREIMEPNRDEIQFFDAAALEAEAFTLNPSPSPASGRGEFGPVDVRLKGFLPSLAEVPEKELVALKERAIKSPFDFIDFWALDFEHRDDKPFEHHWQDYRTRKDRSLKTVSDCRFVYETPGVKRICVKVIDVFGVDTTAVVEITV